MQETRFIVTYTFCSHFSLLLTLAFGYFITFHNYFGPFWKIKCFHLIYNIRLSCHLIYLVFLRRIVSDLFGLTSLEYPWKEYVELLWVSLNCLLLLGRPALWSNGEPSRRCSCLVTVLVLSEARQCLFLGRLSPYAFQVCSTNVPALSASFHTTYLWVEVSLEWFSHQPTLTALLRECLNGFLTDVLRDFDCVTKRTVKFLHAWAITARPCRYMTDKNRGHVPIAEMSK